VNGRRGRTLIRVLFLKRRFLWSSIISWLSTGMARDNCVSVIGFPGDLSNANEEGKATSGMDEDPERRLESLGGFGDES
jgi:hypothetical protein